jgi:hypothetical protein
VRGILAPTFLLPHEPEKENDGGGGDPEARPVEDQGQIQAHGSAYGAARAAAFAAERPEARAGAGFVPAGAVPLGAVPPFDPIDQT